MVEIFAANTTACLQQEPEGFLNSHKVYRATISVSLSFLLSVWTDVLLESLQQKNTEFFKRGAPMQHILPGQFITLTHVYAVDFPDKDFIPQDLTNGFR